MRTVYDLPQVSQQLRLVIIPAGGTARFHQLQLMLKGLVCGLI